MALAISTAELANGLRVVIVQDPRAPEVEVTMRYQVGSVEDPTDGAGTAHLVEHLMFQQVLGVQSLFAKLEQTATYFNADTTWDATTYVSRAATARLGDLLAIEAVRVGFRCTTISDSVFEREREVVANEVTWRDKSSALGDALEAAVFSVGHPYRRAIGGSVDSVRTITKAQACAFADAHYTPGNAVLVVSGNLTIPTVEAALGKFIGKVAKRDAVPRTELPASSAPVEGDIPAPIDDEALLLAWRIPTDPAARARFLAVAPAVATEIDGKIRGRVETTLLGDARAEWFALIAYPGDDESLTMVRDSAEKALNELPASLRMSGSVELGQLEFDSLRQSAIYNLFASFEGGGSRDESLAAFVLAGRDPNQALAEEFKALNTMTRDGAIDLVRDTFGFDRAVVHRLVPIVDKRGHSLAAGRDVHDRGLRRDPPDPKQAHEPATGVVAPTANVARTRTLPNGLKVVLLPLTSVPAVDMRLVFAAGTSDEPADQRGVALVTGDALSWDYRYLNDMMLFAGAGGRIDVQVGFDDTAFVAHGLDMHLDVLLAGLRRLVREGHYKDSPRTFANVLHNEAKATPDNGALTDAWRAARFGAHHPYVEAGLVRHAVPNLSADAVEAFRASHYTPDNATLVIAGHFDPDLADRWIDFLFSDWSGHAVARAAPRADPHPAALAKVEDTSQVYVGVSLPATAGTRAAKLVASEMLAEIADDVRQQLGASYGVNASLSEARLATSYEIGGWVDAARAREVVELLHARTDELRTAPDVAASAFVAARERVLTRLMSAANTASGLAERTEEELARGGSAVDVATVQALRIDDIGGTLAELDLARASVQMRGPASYLTPAFAALGRTPTYVKVDKIEPPPLPSPAIGNGYIDLTGLEDALTTQGDPPSRFEVSATVGFAGGTIADGDGTGAVAAAEIGVTTHHALFGVHLGVAHMSGTHDLGFLVPILKPLDATMLDFSGVIRTATDSRFWGGLTVGLHYDHIHETNDNGSVTATSPATLGIGLELGFDAVRLGLNRLGVTGSISTEFPDTHIVVFSLGLAYRR